MSDFQPGDKVRRIADSYHLAIQGEIYTVKRSDSDGGSIQLREIGGTYSRDRFELVSKKLRKLVVAPNALRAGDKVITVREHDNFITVEREVEPSVEFVVPRGWREDPSKDEHYGTKRDVIAVRDADSKWTYYVREDQDD